MKSRSERPRSGSAGEEGATDAPSAEQQREAARQIILRRLSLRAHSRAELEQALASKGIADEVGAELLDRFTELELVDDADFARQWVGSRHRMRGLSRRALRLELQRKGVDRDVIDEAVQGVGPEQEYEAALAVAHKKLRTLGGMDDVVRARRLAGALARRGYGADLVHRVVRECVYDPEGRDD